MTVFQDYTPVADFSWVVPHVRHTVRHDKTFIFLLLISLFVRLSGEQNDRTARNMSMNAKVRLGTYLKQLFDGSFSPSAINSFLPLMHALWGTSLQNAHSEEMRQTQQLHFSVTPPQFLGTTPQLPLSIIDETSADGLICHSVGCSRLWAAAAVVAGNQLMPGEEKRDKGQAH